MGIRKGGSILDFSLLPIKKFKHVKNKEDNKVKPHLPNTMLHQLSAPSGFI
jgi:hypothetical protein